MSKEREACRTCGGIGEVDSTDEAAAVLDGIGFKNCPDCDGDGIHIPRHERPYLCDRCQGTGEVEGGYAGGISTDVNVPPNSQPFKVPCPECSAPEPCDVCGGSGQIKVNMYGDGPSEHGKWGRPCPKCRDSLPGDKLSPKYGRPPAPLPPRQPVVPERHKVIDECIAAVAAFDCDPDKSEQFIINDTVKSVIAALEELKTK